MRLPCDGENGFCICCPPGSLALHMVMVPLAPWPFHETSLMSTNKESTLIPPFKAKFSPTCLSSYKSSPRLWQGPTLHSAFPQFIRTFSREQNPLFLL